MFCDFVGFAVKDSYLHSYIGQASKNFPGNCKILNLDKLSVLREGVLSFNLKKAHSKMLNKFNMFDFVQGFANGGLKDDSFLETV